MQSPSSASAITTGICQLQGWAYLPQGLLHSIVPLLGFVLELIAFASTCRSWRAALSSYPSKSTLCTFLPPLLIQPHISVQAPHLPSSTDGHKLRTCKVVDPANLRRILCCQIPELTFYELWFAGSSYGQLICCHDENCLVVDVFTGAKVLPPQLPFDDSIGVAYGMLTAPLSSQDSHLLLCAQSEYGDHAFLLDWLIGSNYWSRLDLGCNDVWILQIVEFKGDFIAVGCVPKLGSGSKLYTLSLAPQLGLQEIEVEWWDTIGWPYSRHWLVVCNGILLIIEDPMGTDISSGVYKVYRLDMSTEHATCVEVVNLENDALFIGLDARSPPFYCMCPGRWGGRSNCLFCAHYSQPCASPRLGDVVWVDQNIFNGNIQLRPFWVYPSMLYSDGE